MASSEKPATQPASISSPGRASGMEFIGKYSMIVFFLVLIAFNVLFTPNFLSIDTLTNTLRQVFPIMMVALGMTLVISSGGIDISVGAIMAVSAAVTARLYAPEAGWAIPVACGIGAGGLCGVLNGVLVSKFKIQPIIVTLIVMFAGRGVAQMVLGEFPVSLGGSDLEKFGACRLLGVPVQIVIMLIVAGVMVFVVKKTVFAKRIEAIGENSRAARLVGINVFSVTVGVYVVCGVLCAIAGNMEAFRNGEADAGTIGMYIELDAIAAVAIGGTVFSGGRAMILGTVLGAVIVQLVTIMVDMNNVQSEYSLILKALMLIAAVWVQRGK